ncbi:MAG: ABC transporter substrate-binding protein [Ramlibacter sp.]|nr:ABC transporter substrate-binding protein [Ramlibacter sp.]
MKRRELLATATILVATGPRQALAQPSPRLARLVTVSGAITEVVYLLGAQAQLVGTDTTSLYPAAALRTPKVGYMRQLSAEGVLSLRPDAVIATTEAGPPVVMDQLRSAGVKVELVQADHSWNEVRAKVLAVGRAAGREPQAQALQARLDADWDAVQARVEARVQAGGGARPRVLFILSHSASPQVAGQHTAADALIRYAGGRNAIGGFEGYRPMTAEAMAAAAPDVILTTQQGIDAMGGEASFWQRPELALTPAYRRRSLITLDALLLLGFGPRLPQAVREVHDRLAAA